MPAQSENLICSDKYNASADMKALIYPDGSRMTHVTSDTSNMPSDDNAMVPMTEMQIISGPAAQASGIDIGPVTNTMQFAVSQVPILDRGVRVTGLEEEHVPIKRKMKSIFDKQQAAKKFKL